MKVNLSPFMRDMVYTTATSIFTIIFLVLTVKFLANGLGAEEFGAYSLARRILSLIEPISTVCIAFSLTRYTAISKVEHYGRDYLLPGTLLVFSSCLLIITVGLLFQHQLSSLIFGDNSHNNLFLAVLFLIVAYSMYLVIYSYYRGLGSMQTANFWQIMLIGFGPFLIALQFARYQNAELIIFLMATLLAIAMIPLLREVSFSKLKDTFSVRNKEVRHLLEYGIPRVPGIFAYNAIFAIGPFLSASSGNLKGSGFIMLGQVILRIIEGGMEAFSRVAFPRIAQLYNEHGKQQIANKVTDFVAMIIHFGLFFSVQVFVWSNELILFWLGVEYEEAGQYVRIISLGILPYLAFICLRNIVDAIEVKAVITKYLLVALIVTSVISVVGVQSTHPTLVLSIAFMLGVCSMGILVTIKICRDFSVSLLSLNLIQSLVLNLVFLLLAMGLQLFLHELKSSFVFFSFFLFFQMFLFFVYIMSLHLSGTSWTARIFDRVFGNQQ